MSDTKRWVSKEEQLKIKAVCQGYAGMNSSMRKRLKECGFDVEKQAGGHWKVSVSKSAKHFITVSSTPSDKRTGKNAGRNLIQALASAREELAEKRRKQSMIDGPPDFRGEKEAAEKTAEQKPRKRQPSRPNTKIR